MGEDKKGEVLQRMKTVENKRYQECVIAFKDKLNADVHRISFQISIGQFISKIWFSFSGLKTTF